MTHKLVSLDADVTTKSRSITKPGVYMILPQSDRVSSKLPDWLNTVAKIMTTPALGAKFVEYEMHVHPGGGTKKPVDDGLQHLFFVLDGKITFEINGKLYEMTDGGIVWLPPDHSYRLTNNGEATTRLLWLRRRYIEIEGIAIPNPIITNEKDIEAVPEDTYLEKHLIPFDDELGYDMAFNLLIFEPGTHFGFVESHIMEHGLYMLDGRGYYYLNGDMIEVQKGDYIYMAPFCPQYFAATGWETGRYILYKDVNREYIDDL
jgi:(S)-ureidoglycine aminohydrolase